MVVGCGGLKQVSSWRNEDPLWTLMVSDEGLSLSGPVESAPTSAEVDPVLAAELPQGLPLLRPFACSPAGVKVVLDPGQPCRFTVVVSASAVATDEEGREVDEAGAGGGAVGTKSGGGGDGDGGLVDGPTTAASVAAFVSSVRVKDAPSHHTIYLAVCAMGFAWCHVLLAGLCFVKGSLAPRIAVHCPRAVLLDVLPP